MTGHDGGTGDEPPEPAGGWPTVEPDTGLAQHRSDSGYGRVSGNLFDADTVAAAGQSSGTGRRVVVWRRIRRTAVTLLLLACVPVVAFMITYAVVSVPTPGMVSARLNQTVTLYYANGQRMATQHAAGQSRSLVASDRIPPRVQHAMMAAEDATFATNPGFSLKGVMGALFRHLTGRSGGGSTITQQYVKNATGQDQHSLLRKWVELVKSYKMTRQYSKQEILTAYLNTVYFGRGAYGIQAAAHRYYGVDVWRLSASQAAMLAGLVQQPSRWSDTGYAQARWRYVIGQMTKHHWLAPGSIPRRFPAPLPDRGTGRDGTPDYLEFVKRRVLDELAARGVSMTDLARAGAKIHTTIDPVAERQARTISHQIMHADRDQPNLGNALVSIDPRSGHIVAYYGGDDLQRDGYDEANLPHQPGSAFKPIVLASALQHNPRIRLNTEYDGRSPQHTCGKWVRNAEGDGKRRTTVRDAMTRSVNTVFYRMGCRSVRTGQVRRTALALGIAPTQTIAGNPVPSLQTAPGNVQAGISLGQYPVRPRDMAQAYATLANHGWRNPAHFVTRVTDADETETLYENRDWPTPALDPVHRERNTRIARTVTESMTDVAAHSFDPLAHHRPNAAKTGTAQYRHTGDNAQAWMIGYTPQIVTAVWVGNQQGIPAPIYGNDRNPLGPPAHYRMYGREEPGHIWQRYMNNYLENRPIIPFPPYQPCASPPSASIPSRTPSASSTAKRSAPSTSALPAPGCPQASQTSRPSSMSALPGEEPSTPVPLPPSPSKTPP